MTSSEGIGALPDANRDLLRRPVVAHRATARADGSLQSHPVWFEWDGTYVKISQTRARQKLRNVAHDPHVALSLVDPEDPYRYLEVRDVVERVEDDRDRAFIEGLSQRYLGTAYPHHQPGDERVIVYIRPTGGSAMAA